MTNEFHPCRKSRCWIPKLLDKGYYALWPLLWMRENRDGFYVWDFYVNWTEKQGTRANRRLICEKHHKQILAMFESEAAGDLHEQEVTESWLVRINSKMLART